MHNKQYHHIIYHESSFRKKKNYKSIHHTHATARFLSKVTFDSYFWKKTFQYVITLTSPGQPETDKEVVLGGYGHSRALPVSLMSCSPRKQLSKVTCEKNLQQ